MACNAQGRCNVHSAAPFCWRRERCGVTPSACETHADCRDARYGQEGLACVPDPTGQIRGKACLPPSTYPMRLVPHLFQWLTYNLSTVLDDLRQVNLGRYVYRSRRFDLVDEEPPLPYRPASALEALRCIVLSDVDRSNAVGAALLVVTVGVQLCC